MIYQKNLSILFCIFLFAGCAAKAGPAPSAGFIAAEQLPSSPLLPFHKAWEKQGADFFNYREIYFAPVNTDYLREMTWWGKLGRNEEFETDINLLASFTSFTFKQVFMNDPYYRFHVVEIPGENSLVFEFAIIEVVPNKAILEAMSYAGGPIVGGFGTITGNFLRGSSQSTVAFEARIRSGKTGEVLAMYADREAEKGSIINYKSFSWYGHAKSIIKEWAKQFRDVLNRGPDDYIPDSKPFTFKMW